MTLEEYEDRRRERQMEGNDEWWEEGKIPLSPEEEVWEQDWVGVSGGIDDQN